MSKTTPASRVIQRLPEIFSAGQWGQHVMLSRLRDEVAADIEATHPAVARRLRKVDNAGRPTPLLAPPVDLLDLREPAIGLPDVVLDEATRAKIGAVLEEHQHRDELAKWHLAPRHKILLFGPPGNGKTMLAEALAKTLAIPFLVVKYGGLMESLLGGTGKNIDKIIEFASNGPCVLFVDEFDGIGTARDRAGDVGELRRVTNHLLLALDRLPAHVLMVCATNAETLVDRALRRRFDASIEITAPSTVLCLECAKRELHPDKCNGVDLRGQAAKVAESTHESLDAVVKACREIRRAYALGLVASPAPPATVAPVAKPSVPTAGEHSPAPRETNQSAFL